MLFLVTEYGHLLTFLEPSFCSILRVYKESTREFFCSGCAIFLGSFETPTALVMRLKFNKQLTLRWKYFFSSPC